MTQTILSLVIVAIAVFYLVWQWVKQIRSAFRGEATSCGGCGKCSAAKAAEQPTGASLIRASQISMAASRSEGRNGLK